MMEEKVLCIDVVEVSVLHVGDTCMQVAEGVDTCACG